MPLIIFMIFVVLGPPIGFACTVLFEIVSASLGYGPRPTTPVRWDGAAVGAILFMPFSYLVGGPQAVVTGLVAALSYKRSNNERISLLAVIFAALATANIYALAMINMSSYVTLTFRLWTHVMTIHMGATFACWLIASTTIKVGGRPAIGSVHTS